MFLYFNSLFFYEYLAQLNFDASLCRFWYSCFDARLMLLIIFLSDMSDIFCASLDQCNIQCLQKRQNVLQLINLICEIWQLLQQNVANFSIFCCKIWQIWDFKWQFLAMPSWISSCGTPTGMLIFDNCSQNADILDWRRYMNSVQISLFCPILFC